MTAAPATTTTHPESHGFGRLVSQGSLALADQGVVSAANFLTSVFIARALDAGPLGTFTLAYMAIVLANNFQIVLLTQPHNVLGAGLEGEAYRRYTSGVGLLQVSFSALGMVAAAVFAAAGGGALGLAMLLAIPAWQVQEFLRRVLYTEQRLVAALACDVVAYASQAVLVAVLLGQRELTGTSAMLAIAATAAAAVAPGLWLTRGSFAGSAEPGIAARHVRFGGWLAAGLLGNWLALSGYSYLAALVAGASLAGEFRPLFLLMAPLNIVFVALGTWLPGWFSRVLTATGEEPVFRQAAAILAVVGVGTLAYGVLATAATPWLVEQIFGPGFRPDRGAVAILSLAHVVAVPVTVIGAYLSASGREHGTFAYFRPYLWATAFALTGGWWLISRFELRGIATGIAVSFTIVLADYAWTVSRRAAKRA